MNKEEVRRLISAAFKDVVLGGGIGLWEAQAIDDYESEDVQSARRIQDRKEDWIGFNPHELARCESSLCFFDAEGMKFHLPAFIINELDDLHNTGVVFHLTQLDAYSMGKLVSLSSPQREAVGAFLNWCLTNLEYEFEWPAIRHALKDYWEGDVAPPIIQV